MARIRQQHAQNYSSAGNINAEFEGILRYLNSAELGNKSISELLSSIFDGEGVFDGVVELRLDPTAGLQYRVGTYDNATAGWVTVADISDIRGQAGVDVGVINAPIFFNRQDSELSDGDSVISYPFEDSTDTIVMYLEGFLQAENSYVASSESNTITLVTPASSSLKATVYSIRSSAISNFRRKDTITVAAQVIIPFAHSDQELLLVHRNGILQKSGGSHDYVASSATDSVTFGEAMQALEVISIMTIENTSAVRVSGLMTEDKYTDENGFISYSKIAIEDEAIAVEKVAGLAEELQDKAHLKSSSSTPEGGEGYLWIDRSGPVPQLKYKSQDEWHSTTPESSLPKPSATDSMRYLRVNSSGSGFEIAKLNLSSVVPKTSKGAANGVASLDSTGKVPVDQLPIRYSAAMVSLHPVGSVANGSIHLMRLWKQLLRIDGLSLSCDVGSCDVIITVNGASAGSTYSCSTTPSNQTFGTIIQIDAKTTGKSIDILVTNASADCSGLQLSLSTATEII